MDVRRVCVVGALAACLTASACTSSADHPSGTSPLSSAAPSSEMNPQEVRIVGLGHVALPVPADWATNRTRCGTPQRDTVVVDQPVVETCAVPRPDGVESVTLTLGRPFGFQADEMTEVSGVPAERQETRCSKEFGPGLVCAGAVYVPSEEVSVVAESSTGPNEVDRLLAEVAVLRQRVGVPGYMTVSTRAQEESGERYQQVLSRLGLASRVRYSHSSSWPSGFVVGVSPAPGTMIRNGSTVRVTVAD